MVRAGVSLAPFVQAKLRVGTPNDRFEQEADRVAERVMRMPDTASAPAHPAGYAGDAVQRKCAACASGHGLCTECAEEERLQTKPVVGASNNALERGADRVANSANATPSTVVGGMPLSLPGFSEGSIKQTNSALAGVERTLAGAGRPLDPPLRRDMERRFGHDFSPVRVYFGGIAGQSARDLNADAYTVGQSIVFGVDPPALESTGGRKLLAHELTHVVQQTKASAPSIVQRQAGGGGPAGGPPAAGAPSLSVKYKGCGKAPFTQPVVEAAALAAYNKVVGSNCIKSTELRDEILSEFADLTIDCEQGSGSSPCGMAWRFLSHTVNIYPKALAGGSCGPLESTILHEVVHLTELRLIEHGDLADACEASCFGWGSGDPAKCDEKTLVLHGPRVALGASLAGGRGPFGRIGYEVLRSWTGTAFSLGLHLDVPLTDRDSFVRAGLEVGSNFQLLGSLYGRLYGGLSVPLPPGGALPDTTVGAGLGFDFGRTQLEVLYEVLNVQSRDVRTQQAPGWAGLSIRKITDGSLVRTPRRQASNEAWHLSASRAARSLHAPAISQSGIARPPRRRIVVQRLASRHPSQIEDAPSE